MGVGNLKWFSFVDFWVLMGVGQSIQEAKYMTWELSGMFFWSWQTNIFISFFNWMLMGVRKLINLPEKLEMGVSTSAKMGVEKDASRQNNCARKNKLGSQPSKHTTGNTPNGSWSLLHHQFPPLKTTPYHSMTNIQLTKTSTFIYYKSPSTFPS